MYWLSYAHREHISEKNRINSLKHIKEPVDLKLPKNIETVCLISYETKIPRFLHNTKSYEIYDSVTSLLLLIKSYEACIHPKKGLK